MLHLCLCLKCCFFTCFFFLSSAFDIYLTDWRSVAPELIRPRGLSVIAQTPDHRLTNDRRPETHGKLCHRTDLIPPSAVILQSWTTSATNSPVIELHINLTAEMPAIPSVTAGFAHTHAGHMLSAARRSHGPARYVKLAARRSVGGQSQSSVSRVFGWSFGLDAVLHGNLSTDLVSDSGSDA